MWPPSLGLLHCFQQPQEHAARRCSISEQHCGPYYLLRLGQCGFQLNSVPSTYMHFRQDLAPVLQSGWLDQYKQQLKYITLQHYPQDNCRGTTAFGIQHYLVHANTVSLAQWQQPGIQLAFQAKKQVLMDEFNSVSCGGVDGISNVFGASLWTADYALQMASVGYSGAYLHVRERGITYNMFDPPAGVAGAAGAWTTNSPFYGMLPVAAALQSANGSRVVDLNIKNSMTDATQVHAGYAIYDGTGNNVHSLVIINFKDVQGTMSDYAVDKAFIPASYGNVTIRYLAAPSIAEKTNIAWGAQTYAGVGDANPVPATFASSVADKTVECSQGCTIQVPGPGLAVVFVGESGASVANSTSSTGNSGSNGNNKGSTTVKNSASGMRAASEIAGLGLLGALVGVLAPLV